MLLRRLSRHVSEQNWVAVGLDFLIVVAGVFIGLQLGNWTSARADRSAYEDALERYRAEIEVNLETLQIADEGAIRRLEVVGEALDLLEACDDRPDALDTINRAINSSMGTSGLSIRDAALSELTSSSRLLARQDDEARKRFGDTAHVFDVFLREADFIEMIPLDERAQDNPIIEVGPSTIREVSYFGEDYSRRDRSLRLAVPLSEACRNNELLKDLYTWERWQSALPAVSRILREQLEDDQAWLDEQLE